MAKGEMSQHKKMAMGENPSATGAPTRERYREGGSVHGKHGHSRGTPGHGSHGHGKMKGK